MVPRLLGIDSSILKALKQRLPCPLDLSPVSMKMSVLGQLPDLSGAGLSAWDLRGQQAAYQAVGPGREHLDGLVLATPDEEHHSWQGRRSPRRAKSKLYFVSCFLPPYSLYLFLENPC
ncbi:uncharacterized protein LOC143439065 [Arvicanthis niloticus]|uniref:uncharacterized protein LOC143310665 n=1 Tax=Arvicanthis niloticus TaxID=61156 RepID=UPI00402B366A